MMFAKLKKKIEEEQHNVERSSGLSSVTASPSSSLSNISGSESTSPAKTSSTLSSQESPLRHEQPESLTTTTTTTVNCTPDRTPQKSNMQTSEKTIQSAEPNPKVLQQKTEHIQMLETKVKDLSQQVAVEHKRCLLLQVELQQSSQGHERRERELLARIEALYKSKSDSDQKLQEYRSQVERLIEQQDSKEELEGFQAQELAKVKHLLLASQQELQSREESLRQQSLEVTSGKEQYRLLDTECQRIKAELAQSQKHLSHQVSLQDEVDRMKQEALRSSSVLEEKDTSLKHLKDRVEVLESRLKGSELGGDDRQQALMTERLMLEKKLEESQQHLSEVKTTWSDKIHSLETQIFHLNKKMAEDSEECTALESQVESLRQKVKTLEQDTWKLEEELQEARRQLEKAQSAKAEVEEESKRQLEIMQSEQVSSTAQLEEQLVTAGKERQSLQQRINVLLSSQMEHMEKAIEVERQMTQLEDDNRRLKSDLSRKEKDSTALLLESASIKEALETAEAKLSRLDSECSQSAIEIQERSKQLQQKEHHLQTVAQERDRLMLRNAELSQQLELVRRELEEETLSKERDLQDSQLLADNLQQEIVKATLRVTELEKQTCDQDNSSHRLTEQNTQILKLEDEVAEKNKTIKLQQQRLNDMKKTFKRELRSQAPPTNEMSGGEEPPLTNHNKNNEPRSLEDINFRYLRHVVFKFMTSPEYEAQHLIRAVSVLLHFTLEEEKFIRDTLDWKTSWFGSKPQPANDLKAPALLMLPR